MKLFIAWIKKKLGIQSLSIFGYEYEYDYLKSKRKKERGSINKEQKMQNHEIEQMIYELSKMSPMVISTAYLYAINHTVYGENITEKWLTATQNASALEKAYRKGYYDALNRQIEREDGE